MFTMLEKIELYQYYKDAGIPLTILDLLTRDILDYGNRFETYCETEISDTMLAQLSIYGDLQ